MTCIGSAFSKPPVQEIETKSKRALICLGSSDVKNTLRKKSVSIARNVKNNSGHLLVYGVKCVCLCVCVCALVRLFKRAHVGTQDQVQSTPQRHGMDTVFHDH